MSSTRRCWKFGLMSLFNLLNWVIQEILLDLRSLDTIKLSQTELSAKHAIKLYLVLIQFTMRVKICNLLKYCTFIIFWFQLDMFWILNAKYKYCTYTYVRYLTKKMTRLPIYEQTRSIAITLRLNHTNCQSSS